MASAIRALPLSQCGEAMLRRPGQKLISEAMPPKAELRSGPPLPRNRNRLGQLQVQCSIPKIRRDKALGRVEINAEVTAKRSGVEIPRGAVRP